MAARLTAYIVALIVGITFIAGLIVGAQRADDGPVDVMVLNGHVYTADGEGTTAEAVAIQGNKIVRVGTTRDIQRMRRAQTVVIDAKGGAVLPGFIETDANLFDRAEDPSTLVMGPVLKPTRGEQLATLRATISEAHRRGITSLQTIGGTPQQLERFDELRRDDALLLRVYGGISVGAETSRTDLDLLEQLRARFSDDPTFKAGAAHIVLDGTRSRFTPSTLNRLVAELDKRDWQIVIHADGDRALGMALDAYGHAFEANPAPARGRRHRIASAAIDGPVDFAAFEAIGVTYSTAGAASVEDEIDAVTRQAAWASFDEQRKGSLARDMLADLVVLSSNIFAFPSSRLSDAVVSVTIFDGKVVYQQGVETDN